MEEYIKILEERYERAIDCINSRELPLFVEDTVEDIFSRLVDLIKENKQLEKENKELEYDNATLEKQVKLMRDNFTIAVEQQVNLLLGGSNE